MKTIAGVTPEQQEIMAANVHERWLLENHRNGITSRISAVTGEEQMVDYEDLTEKVKEYDRMLVRTILYGLATNGFVVVKRGHRNE
jgi:hypothetical protein